MLDNVVVLPLVMREQVNIHPVLCLLSVLSGGIIGGVLGMVLAIPVIAGFKAVHRVLAVEMKKLTIGGEPDADLHAASTLPRPPTVP
jgi:predicted PurR-regulated permease PerM